MSNVRGLRLGGARRWRRRKLKPKGLKPATITLNALGANAHDVKLGGWVILASGQLICDTGDSPNCWEKVATLTKKKQGLTNANTKVR